MCPIYTHKQSKRKKQFKKEKVYFFFLKIDPQNKNPRTIKREGKINIRIKTKKKFGIPSKEKKEVEQSEE